ncbi:MAG: alpha/beta hydrolase [Cyanobium sp.]
MTFSPQESRGEERQGLPLIVLREFDGSGMAKGYVAGDRRDEWLRGFLAMSSASVDVEDSQPEGLDPGGLGPAGLREQTQRHLQQIARTLAEGDGEPEIVIAVHGFSNDLKAAEKWYGDTWAWVRRQDDLNKRNVVFIGYRWPAENIASRLLQRLRAALSALPTLPRWLLLSCALLALALIGLVSRGVEGLAAGFAWIGLLVAPVLSAAVLTLVVLRLVVYFRDTYRAAYYGSPDLVELIRQIHTALAAIQPKPRVKLSFLAHSLGNSVVTSALRILADAFENGSIGVNRTDLETAPSSSIGEHLELQRLVMVAPDIPVESVIPRRSNGLRSALRRMKESHVFSNEGDLALRLASTAANFFSFPARTRFSGYRLGNLTIRHYQDQYDRQGHGPVYGILRGEKGRDLLPAQALELRASNAEHRHLQEAPFIPWIADRQEQVTNIPSYFDCTDAITSEGRALVSLALRRKALNLLDYSRLAVAYLLFNGNPARGVDTHGGYFRGESGRFLIYTLVFAGYRHLHDQLLQRDSDLDRFCQAHQLQVVLSKRDFNRTHFTPSATGDTCP